MHNLDGRLKLSYSPMTLYEFEQNKADEDIYNFLENTSIYVIAQRALPVMELIQNDSDMEQIHLLVKMQGISERLHIWLFASENRNFFPHGISAINVGSNLIDNPVNIFHSIIFYRTEFGKDEFVMSANFDRLIHLMSNGIIKLRVEGNIVPFISYKVLYVGQCVDEHIFKRYKAHHALQQILVKEQIIPKNYDKVNDLLVLPFHIESDIISVLDENATEKGFIEATTGAFTFGPKQISLDCEKALVKTLSPKYNKTLFKQYPKSKDGLYQHKLDSYIYRILENLILCYDDGNRLVGDVLGEDASMIVILDNSELQIYHPDNSIL